MANEAILTLVGTGTDVGVEIVHEEGLRISKGADRFDIVFVCFVTSLSAVASAEADVVNLLLDAG